jgi:hypothetical protein
MHAEVRERLVQWLGSESAADAVLVRAAAEGVTDLHSASLVREEEWNAWGVPRIRARELVGWLTSARPASAGSGPGASTSEPVDVRAALAAIPDDRSLLETVQRTATLRVDAADLVAAVRLRLGQSYGLDGIEGKLLRRIEERAIELEQPCPEVFFALERVLARRAHADVLAALDLPGTFVTERRQRDLLARLPALWRDVQAFDRALAAWDDAWRHKAAHPQAMLESLARVIHQPDQAPAAASVPDPSPLVGPFSDVVRALHRAFAGVGTVVARALVERTHALMELLADPRLVDACGASNRDDLLRALDLRVPNDASVRERAAVQYLLTVAELGAQDETRRVASFMALRDLSRDVPWALLTSAPPVASTRG